MADFLFLVPIALVLGGMGLAAFMWALSSGQYDDIEGAAARVLLDDNDRPLRRTRGTGAGERTHSASQEGRSADMASTE
ncbi:MAG: cbb3-type cytochrome oxidase assembly protein CcoS [Proteobacteria bacterium]|nr:cbb3-type cytochrome oxidase assembly protein CcoS [Pseudomonadota bacterium]